MGLLVSIHCLPAGSDTHLQFVVVPLMLWHSPWIRLGQKQLCLCTDMAVTCAACMPQRQLLKEILGFRVLHKAQGA
jgi:hypothetical protein